METVILYSDLSPARQEEERKRYAKMGRKAVFKPRSEYEQLRQSGEPFHTPLRDMAYSRREAEDILRPVELPGGSSENTHAL